ncbi:hypothetical protein [Clostridium sp. DL1XJH146]
MYFIKIKKFLTPINTLSILSIQGFSHGIVNISGMDNSVALINIVTFLNICLGLIVQTYTSSIQGSILNFLFIGVFSGTTINTENGISK